MLQTESLRSWLVGQAVIMDIFFKEIPILPYTLQCRAKTIIFLYIIIASSAYTVFCSICECQETDLLER